MRVPKLGHGIRRKRDTNLKKKKKHFVLSPLVVWVVLWTVNIGSEFQVKIFTNNRDITKISVFAQRQQQQ